MQVSFLGLSKDTVTILMDILFEVTGQNQFEIYLNKDFGIEPYFKIKEYAFVIYKSFNPNAQLKYTFGTAGPYNKHLIFEDFNIGYGIHKKDYATIIHPKAYVAPSSKLATGIVIEPNVSVSSQTNIGFGVMIKRGAQIGHHCEIGDYCDINPGAILSGNVKVGKGCQIGSGAVIRDNIEIGENSIIGLGSVVTKNMPPNSIAYGNPCKVIKMNDKWSI
jgi:sugar O-acyltransferase (sialic acid O-acetyltransferase NeuD family)